jgi:uncharacterized membrane protein
MSTLAARFDTDPERLWGGGVLALLAVLVGGSLLLPELVYDGFIWHYFWGPVQADAHNAQCAIRASGATEYLFSSSACQSAAEPVAYPGYTLVSEVGYVVVLLIALTGVVFLMERLDVGTQKRFYWALIPFMFFGGALRVVEDAHNAMEGGGVLTSYPVNTLFISPIIYFTVFFITVACLVVAAYLARRGYTDDLHRPLFAFGLGILVLTVGYLFALAATPNNPVVFYPQVLVVILLLSVVSTGLTWYAIEAAVPSFNRGTEKVGLFVLFAHAVDGAANVVGLDYMTALGAGPNLVPKHPVNKFVVDTAGAAWPFLVVKLVAATFVVWIFEPELFDESPRYTMLLLVAVTAVGLGPGTRDMLRATLGI